MTQQPNSVDCGVYALLFAERLLQHYGEYTIAARIDRNKKKDDLFPFLQFEAKCADDLRAQIQTIVDALTKSTVQTQAEVQTLEEESDDSDIEVVGMDIKPKTPTRSVKRPYSSASDVRAAPLPKKAPRVLTNAIPSVSPFPQFQPDYYTQLTPVFHPVYLMPQLIQPPVILSPLCPAPERSLPVAPNHTLSPCKVLPICGVVTTPAQRIGTPFTPRPSSVVIGGFSSLPARRSFLVCSTNTPNRTLRRLLPFGNEAAAPCAATASECSSFLPFTPPPFSTLLQNHVLQHRLSSRVRQVQERHQLLYNRVGKRVACSSLPPLPPTADVQLRRGSDLALPEQRNEGKHAGVLQLVVGEVQDAQVRQEAELHDVQELQQSVVAQVVACVGGEEYAILMRESSSSRGQLLLRIIETKYHTPFSPIWLSAGERGMGDALVRSRMRRLG